MKVVSLFLSIMFSLNVYAIDTSKYEGPDFKVLVKDASGTFEIFTYHAKDNESYEGPYVGAYEIFRNDGLVLSEEGIEMFEDWFSGFSTSSKFFEMEYDSVTNSDLNIKFYLDGKWHAFTDGIVKRPEISYSATSVAATKILCWPDDSPSDIAELQIDEKTGIIIPFDAEDEDLISGPIVKAAEGSLFEHMYDLSVAENVKIYVKDGYSFAKVITTADSATISIDLQHRKGAYEYKDLGSGNGDKKVNITCK